MNPTVTPVYNPFKCILFILINNVELRISVSSFRCQACSTVKLRILKKVIHKDQLRQLGEIVNWGE